MISMGLSGMDKVKLKLNRLRGIVNEKALENNFLDAAKIIKSAAKQKAPIAKKGHWSKKGSRSGSQHWVEPGALRRGIVAKKFKGQTKHPPAAFCAIDYSIAPHAHLVEFGARGGKMPATPFFRPAIDTTKNEVANEIKTGLRKAILKEVKKK